MSRKAVTDFLTKELSKVSPHFFEERIVRELLISSIPTYIRVNTSRISTVELKERLERRGVFTEKVEKLDFVFKVLIGEGIGFLPEHLAGYFYIQDLASILAVLALNPKKGEHVLDACAAPGGKSTLISQIQENKGLVIANEIDKKRGVALKSNVERMGSSNVLITFHDMSMVPSESWIERFDKVLIDAPCTGDGLLPKKEEKLSPLNSKSISEISSLQKKILETSFKLLKKGGELVYSTCSFVLRENEFVVRDFLVSHPNSYLKRFSVPISPEKAFIIDETDIAREISELAGRYFPKKHKTIGFFIAKIGKK